MQITESRRYDFPPHPTQSFQNWSFFNRRCFTSIFILPVQPAVADQKIIPTTNSLYLIQSSGSVIFWMVRLLTSQIHLDFPLPNADLCKSSFTAKPLLTT